MLYFDSAPPVHFVDRNAKPISAHPLMDINLIASEHADLENTNLVKLTEAALRVAALIHESAGRDKDDVFIPYLNHVVMAHNILHAAGERDPVVLAATLCHDTIEDINMGSDLLGKKRMVQLLLSQELKKEGFSNADSLATSIAELAWRVTNDETMNEGKTIYQIDRLDEMTPNAIRIKMADHAASILEDTIHPPNWDAKRHARKMSDWWSMAASNAAQRPANQLISNLVLDLCDLNWEIKEERRRIGAIPDATLQQDAAKALKSRVDGLTLESLLERAAGRSRPILASDRDNAEWLHHPTNADMPSGGVLAFGLHAGDQVPAFRVIVEPSDEKENYTNQMVQNLLERLLEAKQGRPNHAIIHRYTTRNDGVSYREIHLEHPVPAKDFLRIASTLEIRKGRAAQGAAASLVDHALLDAYAERFGVMRDREGTPLSGNALAR